MASTFPRRHARTQRFTLGAPRAFTISPDGSRLVFLRSRSGTDRANLLWVRELPDPANESGHPPREYPAADPGALLSGAEEELSAEERARRERTREGSGGIVGYATDTAVELAAFALSGRLFVAELRAGTARELATPAPVVDPRPSPDGRRVAYVSGGALRVIGSDGTGDRALAAPEDEPPAGAHTGKTPLDTDGSPGTVTFGLAEFIAAEEMSRTRGYWWSPDSDRLLVARVDDSPVTRWWIADPANPASAPAEVAYPAAGTANADVSLHLVDAATGERRPVEWDRARWPYLARVHWSSAGPPLLLVQTRDQREQQYLTLDLGGTGPVATSVVHTEKDPAWLELFGGVPAWAPDGTLVRVEDRPGAATGTGDSGARVLLAGERQLTTDALHVRAVLDVGERDVLFSASPGTGASGTAVGDIGVYRVPLAGEGAPERLAAEEGPHVASGVRGGDVLLLSSVTLDRPGSRVTVHRPGPDGAGAAVDLVPSHAETPGLGTAPLLTHAGRRRIPAAVLLPTGYRAGDGPLPVLMDPYGGPHGQRVVAAHNAYLSSQWFADQGFAVVVADGRGAPGRSPGWEKAVSRDLAAVTLDDQVEALHALAEDHPLDLSRVGIRGWSYGGYLAALAVLRRPDVFHAAVAGAPVTDWRLYDTHYTERYCGTPEDDPESYAAASLITDDGLSYAADTHRPLMLIHGLADDNVAAAHTLRLSSALLAAGRPHEVLPLSGVTHMTPQEQVAENLLHLQAAFLRRALPVV
ncbi:prolyl oligopeptidase family serine peptidase [Streptomyces sp. HNM0574]|uniref:S9 family peptidase n=1 Tax=Streptomyces sp. HNM0574 TaxID=2714954 RepID=UPI00146BF5C3|nr:prolyl oligopeptidase family serine peptidase [Streptomyces sp. HNM0574]NLU67322.1 S9 family peptidase [Streptomyces sp. HNM0574]